MKMRHSGKILAALVAATLSGGAHATLDADQIVFYAYNGNVDSVIFDLGLNLSNFPTSSSSTIVWDFDNNTVTGTLPGGATVDYGNIWSTFTFTDASPANPGVPGAATTRWGVIGANGDLGDIVTTSLAPPSQVDNMTGTQLTETSVDVPNVYLAQNGFLGNHGSVDNGANRGTTGQALHYNGFGANDNWRNRSPFSAGRTGSGSMPFYYLGYSEPTGTLTTFAGSFTFDAANATLTYSAAIPEPSAWALVAAGALGLGGFARRRKQA
jgi:hypothetical protein